MITCSIGSFPTLSSPPGRVILIPADETVHSRAPGSATQQQPWSWRIQCLARGCFVSIAALCLSWLTPWSHRCSFWRAATLLHTIFHWTASDASFGRRLNVNTLSSACRRLTWRAHPAGHLPTITNPNRFSAGWNHISTFFWIVAVHLGWLGQRVSVWIWLTAAGRWCGCFTTGNERLWIHEHAAH